MRFLIAVAFVALASAANPAIVLQMPNDKDNNATITWNGTKLSIPGHTEELAGVIVDADANTEAIDKLTERFDKYVTDELTQDHITINIEALKNLTEAIDAKVDSLTVTVDAAVANLTALTADFDAYKVNQASEDHNTVDVQALQDMVVDINTEVAEIDLDLKRTPLKHHASQCPNGDVDLDARKCTCRQTELQPRFSVGSPNPKGRYVGGAAYPTCQVCSNVVCGTYQYRAGSCNTDAGNSFSCKSCTNTQCSAGKYRTGSCGTVYKHTSRRRQNVGVDDKGNNYQCTPCSNASCGAGKYRSGTCGTIWASRRRNLQNHNGYKCNNCPAGQYSNNGDNSCTKCPNGKMTLAGWTTCKKCATGKYVVRDQRRRRRRSDPVYEIRCDNCATGLYQNQEHQTGCKNCPGGKATATAGLASCSQCNAGRYARADQRRRRGTPPVYRTCQNCGAGQYSTTGGSCTKCPNGKMTHAGWATCAKCAAGKRVILDQRRRRGYQPTYEIRCDNCATGLYQNQEHQTGCKSCPGGKATATAGLTSCSQCNAGKYAHSEQRRRRGYIQNYNTCQNCGAGQTSTTGGSCSKCPAGKAAAAGQSPCAKCATGKYVVRDQRRRRRRSNPTYETGCNNCVVTQYTDQQHQASCKPCSNKYANKASAATACGSNCPSGKTKKTYWNGRRRRGEGIDGRRRTQGWFGYCQ